MPFLLIVQLVFSGGFFTLPEAAKPATNLTVTKWGLTALCVQGDYNSLPMVSIWNNALKLQDVEVEGEKPLLEAFRYINDNNMTDAILKKSAEYNQNPAYDFNPETMLKCWGWLIFWTIAYLVLAVILLERIDKDKR